jgi:hypothetical protein
LGSLLAVATIARAQTYTVQRIGLFDSAHTQSGGYSNTVLAFGLSDGGAISGTSDRYDGDSANGYDAWVYSPATAATLTIGLLDAAHTRGGGYSDNESYQLNSAGQVLGFGERFSGSIDLGTDAWLYSSTTNTTLLIGLTDAAHQQADGSSNNEPSALNVAGQVIGTATRSNAAHSFADYDAWLYSPATNSTQVIGLTDPAHTSTANGYSQNSASSINAAGQVVGSAERFSGGTQQGFDTWFYSPTTHTSQVIGLTDSTHIQTGGYAMNQIAATNDAGQVIGFGNRYSGSTVEGQDAWLYSATTNTTQVIGLTDSAHTQTGGYANNQSGYLNAAGYVAGYAQRFNGDSDQGYDAWIYSPSTHSSQIIGLTDAAHTQTGGYSSNQAYALNAAGQVAGNAYRFNGSTNQGFDAWIYSPTTNTTQLIGPPLDSVHTSTDGYSNRSVQRMNAAGQVVGAEVRFNGNDSAGQDLWFYDSSTNTTYNDLVSSPSASGYDLAVAEYLGEDGTVLGYYWVNGVFGAADAFLWTEHAGFRDLGTFIQGGLTAAGWENLAEAVLADGTHHIYGNGTVLGGTGNQTFALTSVTVPGDYNGNGIVDAADYVVWRNNLGTTHVLSNDTIGGTIGAAQYNQWRVHFGESVGSGAGAVTNAAVPEPATFVLLMFAVASCCLLRRRAAEKAPATR